MADSKVSELTSATTVGGSDLLYLVQSNTSKKVTADNFFANINNAVLKGNVAYDPTVQLLASPGIVDIARTVTHFASDASGGVCTIPTGKTNQVKIIVMISTAGGVYTINNANIAASSNVVFTAAGDTATLLYTNNKWFMVGGSATLT